MNFPCLQVVVAGKHISCQAHSEGNESQKSLIISNGGRLSQHQMERGALLQAQIPAWQCQQRSTICGSVTRLRYVYPACRAR
jgi:hypothetical protein